MDKNKISSAISRLSVIGTVFFASQSLSAEGRGPFILPGELDFLAVGDLEVYTASYMNGDNLVEWTGDGFHAGVQQVSCILYNCKEIPNSFTKPSSSDFYFKVVDGYGEEVANIEKDITGTFNKLSFIHGDFKNVLSESVAVMRGGKYTLCVGISPELFSYEIEAVFHDEACARVSNTTTNVGLDLAPAISITTGFPYDAESVAGEKTLHWMVASSTNPSVILAEDTETFEFDTSKSLLAGEVQFALPVADLTPGEYIYTLESDYAPACRTFNAYVYDVLTADISLDKTLYTVGDESEAVLKINMSYGYPYVAADPETKLPTIFVTTKLLDDSTTDKFSDSAWANTDLNYTADIKVSLEKITKEVVDEYKGKVPISVRVNFNDKTQYEGVVVIPFKYDSSGIESVFINNNASPNYKYYNIFGVEVDNSYRGIVITSDGRKILRK